MRLLPCITFTVHTQASLSKIIERLKFYIEPSRCFFPDDHAPYIGTLSSLGFTIRRIARYRNPFLPVIQGHFQAGLDNTEIYLTIRLPLAAVLLVMLGLVFTGLGIPFVLVSGDGWLVLAILAMSTVGLAWTFWYEVICSRRELIKILLGASVRSHRPPLPRGYKNLLTGLVGLTLAFGLYYITTWQPLPASTQSLHDCAQIAAASPYCQLQPTYRLMGHPTASALAISTDGKTLVSGGRDKAIRVWDVATGQLRKTLQSDSGMVQAVAIAPDGKTVVSGGGDLRVRIWDITSDQPPKVLSGHTGPITQVKISTDGKTAVSAGQGEIKVWDVVTGQLQASLPHLAHSPHLVQPAAVSTFRLLALSPDGSTALLESGNQWMAWNLAKQQPTVLQTPWAETLYGFVRNAQISPDGQSVVTTAYEQPITQLKVWNLATGEAMAQSRMSATAEKYWLNTVALSRDRIVGSTPEGLKIWHLPTAQLEATLAAPPMTPLVISPDGQHLAGIIRDETSQQATIQVWQRLETDAQRNLFPFDNDEIIMVNPVDKFREMHG